MTSNYCHYHIVCNCGGKKNFKVHSPLSWQQLLIYFVCVCVCFHILAFLFIFMKGLTEHKNAGLESTFVRKPWYWSFSFSSFFVLFCFVLFLFLLLLLLLLFIISSPLPFSIVRGYVVISWLSARKTVTRDKKKNCQVAKIQDLKHLKTSISSPPIQF